MLQNIDERYANFDVLLLQYSYWKKTYICYCFAAAAAVAVASTVAAADAAAAAAAVAAAVAAAISATYVYHAKADSLLE